MSNMDLINNMTVKVFNIIFHQEILLPKMRSYPRLVRKI